MVLPPSVNPRKCVNNKHIHIHASENAGKREQGGLRNVVVGAYTWLGCPHKTAICQMWGAAARDTGEGVVVLKLRPYSPPPHEINTAFDLSSHGFTRGLRLFKL